MPSDQVAWLLRLYMVTWLLLLLLMALLLYPVDAALIHLMSRCVSLITLVKF